MKSIKNRIKSYWHFALYCLKYLKKIIKRKRIFLLCTDASWNLGDHQISVSEIEFLKKSYPKHTVIEFDLQEYWKKKFFLMKIIKPKDLIYISGGGNVGNVYPYHEQQHRDIVSTWANNNIVFFPQSVYFTDDEKGKAEFKKSAEIYSSHKKLIFSAREKYTYELIKDKFKCKVVFVPDIVLSCDYSHFKDERENKALLFIRDDVEGTLSNNEVERIEQQLKGKFTQVIRGDTQLSFRIPHEERQKYLDEMFSVIKSSQIVISDRMHAMIFCAITGTPCIAISNYNKKVVGTYEIIKNLDYIRYIGNDTSSIMTEIEKLDLNKNHCYNNSDFNNKYLQLVLSNIGGEYED